VVSLWVLLEFRELSLRLVRAIELRIAEGPPRASHPKEVDIVECFCRDRGADGNTPILCIGGVTDIYIDSEGSSTTRGPGCDILVETT
jgi:hypothetical protein